jgi:hypothetical protein
MSLYWDISQLTLNKHMNKQLKLDNITKETVRSLRKRTFTALVNLKD